MHAYTIRAIYAGKSSSAYSLWGSVIKICLYGDDKEEALFVKEQSKSVEELSLVVLSILGLLKIKFKK